MIPYIFSEGVPYHCNGSINSCVQADICMMIGMCVTALLGGVASKWRLRTGVSDNLLPEMDMFGIS